MRVGLTGGVASGKSTVSAMLAELGAVVIDADQLAREVVAQQAALIQTATVDTAHFAYRLAQCLLPTRRLDEIEAELARDEGLWPMLGNEATIVRLRRQRVRTLLCTWRGDADAAQRLIDAADQPLRVHSPADWARLGRVRAINLRLQQRWDDAAAAAQEAIARCDVPGALTIDRAHAHTELGLALLGQGNVAGADSNITLAEQHFDQVQVLANSVLRADALLARGRIYLMAGRAADALPCFERAERGWAEVHPGSVWHGQAQQGLAEARSASADI